MFSKLFKKKQQPVRKLDHPSQLEPGDMLVMDNAFVLPAVLRSQNFIVEAINGYQFQYGEEGSFRLRGDSDTPVFFSINSEDGKQVACFSLMIEREHVEQLFSLDAFAQIFDSEEMTELQTKVEPDAFENWLAPSYKQSGEPIIAYYYERDIRKKKPTKFEEDDAEPVQLFNLVSNDGKKAIDIEVWEDGETDVLLTIYRPLSDIKDLFPKESA